MASLQSEIPDAERLKRRYDAYQKAPKIIFAFVLACDVVWLLHLFAGSGRTVPSSIRWFWPLVGLVHWLWVIQRILSGDSVRLSEAVPKRLGRFSREEIEGLVSELLKPFRHRAPSTRISSGL